MKVNFLIVGAQKCGTTTLFNILKSHPDVVGCSEKEPDFFSKSKDWRSNISDYEALFTEQPGAKYFEASTSYTLYPTFNLNVWDAIYDYNPDMKIIYIVRNPIDRIISSYMHVYERGYTNKSLEDAICHDQFLISTSRYYMQIRPYIERFGQRNVLILEFEELIRSARALTERVATFLELDPTLFGDVEAVHANASLSGAKKHHKYENPSLPLRIVKRLAPAVWDRISDNSQRSFEKKPELSAKYREVILRMLMPEMGPLEELLGRDLSEWFEGVEVIRYRRMREVLQECGKGWTKELD